MNKLSFRFSISALLNSKGMNLRTNILSLRYTYAAFVWVSWHRNPRTGQLAKCKQIEAALCCFWKHTRNCNNPALTGELSRTTQENRQMRHCNDFLWSEIDGYSTYDVIVWYINLLFQSTNKRSGVYDKMCPILNTETISYRWISIYYIYRRPALYRWIM